MNRLKKYSLILIMLLIGIAGLAQETRSELEKKKSRLKKDIEYKNQLLKKTYQEKKNKLNQLVILNKKISEREELIATIRSEIELLNERIRENQELIESMERDIKLLKEEYAKMIQFAYRNKNANDKIMYIFSAKDFNQAYKRLRYLQQYTEYRKRQAEAIMHLESLLKKKNEDLAKEKAEKEQLLRNMHEQKKTLDMEISEQKEMYVELQTQEKQLKKEIKAKQKEQAQLQRAIERIIAEELRKAREASGSSAGGWKLTPEAKALANSFTANKAKLPWPVEKGVITETFGVHSHPVLKQIKIRNNGVTISTEENATARAVFDGVVSRIVIIPGAGKAVIIRHGDYLTVYGNLGDVYVQAGDKVKIKQQIGQIISDDGKTELQFEIRKGMDAEPLDPSTWLYKAL